MDDSSELLFSRNNVVFKIKILIKILNYCSKKGFLFKCHKIENVAKWARPVVAVDVVVLDEFGSSVFTKLFESFTGLLFFHLREGVN